MDPPLDSSGMTRVNDSNTGSHNGDVDQSRELSGQAEAPVAQESARALNVTDALSYLDAVKTQFVERPDVYNNFLDIMKDFKSQAIDTPGVIERVSTLFRGHSDLIQGFNTFLPPGYRIDCSGEAATITVTTPEGTTTQSTANKYQAPVDSTSVRPEAHSVPGNDTTLLSQPASPPAPAGSPMPFGTSSAATTLGGMSNKDLPDKGPKGPASGQEFHHAIQYVNKIKTRFEDDPETYKKFLDILHSYRKEQNQDDVYSQVQSLFKDAPDLLSEFKNFLPVDGSAPFGAGSFGDSAWPETEVKKTKTDGPPPKRRKRPQEKEIQPAPAAAVPPPKTGASRSKKSKHGHAKENARAPSPSYHPYSRPPTPSQHLHSHTHQQSHTGPPHSTAATSSAAHTGNQDELAFFDRAKKAFESRETYEEFLKLLNLFSREFIDARSLIKRAESFLGDGELYTQFKDLMGWDDKRDGDNEGPPGSLRNHNNSQNEVEERYGKSYRRLSLAETTLACSGRDELCRSVLNDVWVSHPTWASEESGFVSHKKNSYEEALHKSEEERHEFQFYVDIITRTIALLQPLHDRILEMSADERHAYRLPADFGGSSKGIYHRAIKKVYGRDAQGLEVLQALQECPGNAIPVILPRLKQKNEEWRRAQREWNRVWREVDGRNFYKSLDHQGISFKANDKKYITTKSFVSEIENAKSELGERLLAAKAKARAFKKSRQVPSTGSENENAQRHIFALENTPHLEFSFSDLGVLQDSLKLVFSFLDRSALQYSSHERRTVERALRTLIPLICMLPTAEFDSVFGPPLEADTAENEETAQEDAATASDDGDELHQGSASGSKSHNKSGASSGRRSAGGGSHGHGGVHPNDLRKKLLKTVQEKAAKARSGSASASRAVSPAGSDEDHGKHDEKSARSASPNPKKKKVSRAKEAPEMHHVDCEEWVKFMSVSFDSDKSAERENGMDVDLDDVEKLAKYGLTNEKPFFTNTTLYALLRLLQLLYSRLLLCKEIGAKLTTVDTCKSGFTVNKVAEELGLVDGHGPGAVLALAASVPVRPSPNAANTAGGEYAAAVDITTQANGHPGSAHLQDMANATTGHQDRAEAHFYGYMLEACEKLFEGELDQATFEENMRFLFGTKAYNVFTLDKLIAALIKQVQTVVVDSKCQELAHLLTKIRSKGAMTVRELIAYRREAEQYLGPDDHLYRVQWDEATRAMRVWLLGSGDASVTLALHARAGVGAHWQQATRWRAYAESYVLEHPTELVDEDRVRARVQRPFLARTRESSDDELETGTAGGPGPSSTGAAEVHGLGHQTGADASGNGTEPGAGVAPGASGERGRARWVCEEGLEVGVRPGTYELLFRDGSGACGYVVRSREESAVLARRRREGEERRREKLASGLDGLLVAA